MKNIFSFLFIILLVLPFSKIDAQSKGTEIKSTIQVSKTIFELEKLPYSMDALEPFISKTTLEFHYGKHHQTYVNNLNKLIVGTEFENSKLEEIVLKSKGAIFNNAAQVWNHTFYWNGLSPKSSLKPQGELLEAIEKEFGSFEAFKEKFTNASLNLFGSGWSWLVKDKDGKLEIVQTSNAENPILQGKTPIFVCDVWEHAYYIDQKNKRAAYVEAFWNLVDWKKAEENFIR